MPKSQENITSFTARRVRVSPKGLYDEDFLPYHQVIKISKVENFGQTVHYEEGIHILAGRKYCLTECVSPPITLARKEIISFILQGNWEKSEVFLKQST